MKHIALRHWILGGVLGIAAGSTAFAEDMQKSQHSGFLGDDSVYAKLEEVEIRQGVKAKRWISPAMNFANYKAVIVDDVVLYPKPEPTPQVSAETLRKISAYLSEKLRGKLNTVLNVVDAPGAGVLRMETAVTGVAIKTEGMKPYEVLPVMAVFGGLKAVTGTRDLDVYVFVEARFVDSQTGERVGAAMRRIEGEELKGKKDKLVLADMQDSLDQATDDAAGSLSTLMQSRSE